jgi:anti-sigma factor RsiW
VLNREHHLQDERLFDCYLAVRSGDSLAPPDAEHLTDCEACGERYAELTQFMESLSVEAASEADAIFTPERLRAQQQHITRRLDHLDHPARVIMFPGLAASLPIGSSAPRSARRWIAATAAAALFVGVGVLLDREAARAAPPQHVRGIPRQAVLKAPVADEVALPDAFQADEAFLSEIELAGDRPRTHELLAFDALTPHVREITLR